MIKQIHIFDVDGTLVDSSHRYRTILCDDGVERIDLPFWIENSDKVLEDKPLPLVKKFRQLVESTTDYAIIATARIWCDLSKKFCQIHDINANSVIGRTEGDNRGGAELKIAHVNRLLNLRQFRSVDTIHVYEDNKTYLEKIATHFEAKGFTVCRHFFNSNQGH